MMHRPDDQTYWEQISQTRWGSYISQNEKAAILLGYQKAGTPSQGVEMGCGGGRWSKLLYDKGWQMTCTDVNQNRLDACQKKIPSARCIRVTSKNQEIPCESNSQGMVLCIEVPPIIESDWFLVESRRVLKTDGIMVGVFLNGNSFRGWFARLKGDKKFYNRSYPLWRKELAKNGFQMLHENGICWFPFSRNSNSPLVPAFNRLEKILYLNKIISFSPWVVFVAKKNN